MAKRKENRFDLVCDEDTSIRYPIEVSSTKKSSPLELKKYHPKLKKHVLFKKKKQARAS